MHMRTINTWLVLLVAISAMGITSYVLAQSTLTASVNRTDIALDDLVELEVSSSESQAQKPDFSPLEADFEILGTNTKREARIVNRSVSTTTTWALTLKPKRQGRLLIPSFRIDSAVSDAIAIAVSKPEGNKTLGDQLLRVETKISKSIVYVNEPFIVTYVGYQDPRVAELEAPRLNQLIGASVQAMPVTQYEKVVNGRRLNIFEAAYLVTPEKEGELEIPPLTRRMKVRDTQSAFRFFGERTENYRTDGASIEVKGIPADWPANADWFPAEKVAISRTFDKPLSNYKLGDPIAMSITISAVGNSSSAIPSIDLEKLSDSVEGLRLFPEKPALGELPPNAAAKLSGSRTAPAVLIVDKAGIDKIPGFRLAWWNVSTESVEYAVLEDAKLTMRDSAAPGLQNERTSSDNASSKKLGADSGAQLSGPPSSAEPAAKIPLWTTLVFAACLLGLAILFWQNRQLQQQLANHQAEKSARQALLIDDQIDSSSLYSESLAKLNWHYGQYRADVTDPAHLQSYADVLLQTLSTVNAKTLHALSDAGEYISAVANNAASGGLLESISELDQALGVNSVSSVSFSRQSHEKLTTALRAYLLPSENESLSSKLYA